MRLVPLPGRALLGFPDLRMSLQPLRTLTVMILTLALPHLCSTTGVLPETHTLWASTAGARVFPQVRPVDTSDEPAQHDSAADPVPVSAASHKRVRLSSSCCPGCGHSEAVDGRGLCSRPRSSRLADSARCCPDMACRSSISQEHSKSSLRPSSLRHDNLVRMQILRLHKRSQHQLPKTGLFCVAVHGAVHSRDPDCDQGAPQRHTCIPRVQGNHDASNPVADICSCCERLSLLETQAAMQSAMCDGLLDSRCQSACSANTPSDRSLDEACSQSRGRHMCCGSGV